MNGKKKSNINYGVVDKRHKKRVLGLSSIKIKGPSGPFIFFVYLYILTNYVVLVRKWL